MMLQKIKCWKAISLVIFFMLLVISNVFAWYFKNNPMYVDVWFKRLMGDREFYLEGQKIKTPKSCVVEPSERLAVIDFRCATSQKEFTGVSIAKTHKDFIEIAEMKKTEVAIFEEFDSHIRMVLESKRGLDVMTLSIYYLKHQNVAVYSESQNLSKTFADLLLKYDFRAESIPLEGDPNAR